MKRLIMTAFIIFFAFLIIGCSVINTAKDTEPSKTSESSPTPEADEATKQEIEPPDPADIIRMVFPQLSGYWSNQESEYGLQYFLYFEYDAGNNEAKCNQGWYYSETTEFGYAVDIVEIAEDIYTITFWVPANEEEGVFEIHDGYDYDLVIDTGEIAGGKLKILTYSGEEMVFEYFAGSMEEALEKYDDLTG